MRPFSKSVGVILATAILLCACAITPRVSSWNSPKEVTKAQVFNAALVAGGQNGMATSASDRESGTMTFSKQIGRGTFILSVSIVEADGLIKVTTTGNYVGDIAIKGLHEEVIRNFHVFLFRNLNVSNPSEMNVRIEQGK